MTEANNYSLISDPQENKQSFKGLSLLNNSSSNPTPNLKGQYSVGGDIIKSFRANMLEVWWTDMSAWNNIYKNEIIVAEKFLLEECKNMSDIPKKLLIKKIAEKIVYFEADKEKIEDECNNALQDLKNIIEIQKILNTKTIFEAWELIKSNPGLLKESPELLTRFLLQIQELQPNVYKILNNDNKLWNILELSKKWSPICLDDIRLLYSTCVLSINLFEEKKVHDFESLFSLVNSNKIIEAINILYEKFPWNTYSLLYESQEIKKIVLENKKEENQSFKEILWKNENNEKTLDKIIEFCSLKTPKDDLKKLLEFYSNNKDTNPKTIFEKLKLLKVDFYYIKGFYFALQAVSKWENEQLYKDILELANSEVIIDKETAYKVEHKLNDKLKLIFWSEELSKEKLEQINSLMKKLVVDWEIRWVVEFKKWLKNIFKDKPEIVKNIDNMTADGFLDFLLKYNEQNILMCINTLVVYGFNKEKFENISEEELNNLIKLNKSSKQKEIIDILDTIWIINKPQNKEDLDILIIQIKELLNNEEKKLVLTKTQKNPDRMDLFRDVYEWNIDENSKEYELRLNKIQEREKTEESKKNEEKEKSKNSNTWINDLLAGLDISKQALNEIVTLPSWDKLLRIDEDNCKIIFDSSWSEVVCKWADANNILQAWHEFEELGLGFVINDFAQENSELLKKMQALDSTIIFDMKDWLKPKEKISILNILWKAIFDDKFIPNNDIFSIEKFYKTKNNDEWEWSLASILNQEKWILKDWKYNRAILLSLIK